MIALILPNALITDYVNETQWATDIVSGAIRIIKELQAMDTVCHLDDHFEFLKSVEGV
jgi:hypothetical protein